MGRSLFSTKFIAAPAVRTEPDRVPDPQCQKWSIWNKFDPDSDEFFENAVDEAFTDLDTARQQQADGIADDVRATVVDASPDTSDTSDGGESDVGSPMATGSDGPVSLIAQTNPMVSSTEWQHQFLEDGAVLGLMRRPPRRLTAIGHNPDNTVDRPDLDHIISATRSNRYSRVRATRIVPTIVTAPPVRPVIIAADLPMDVTPVIPQTLVADTTAVIPQVPSRSPSPPPAETPSTPQTLVEDHSLVSPSPPGSVTPARPYTWMESSRWNSIPAMPASPTRVRTNRDGPLTNPRARVSYARLASAPSLIVQNGL